MDDHYKLEVDIKLAELKQQKEELVIRNEAKFSAQIQLLK